MPWQSGSFAPKWLWTGDAAAGTKITATRHDEYDGDLANGIDMAICKDGSTSIAADIPWGGYKITGLGNPDNPQDAASKNYVDGIRSFSGAISITGSTPESRLKFTGSTGPWGMSVTEATNTNSGMSFGVRAASWVWNDKEDFSGTDVMALSAAISPTLTLLSKDATATSSPTLVLRRDSATVADGDYLGGIHFQGKNSAAVVKTYGRILTNAVDSTSGTEDCTMAFAILDTGVFTTRLSLTGAGGSLVGTWAVTGTATISSTLTVSGSVEVTTGYVRAGGDIISDTFRSNSASGQVFIAGGTAGQSGGHIELYAPSHPTLANRIYYDAALHTFRNQAGGGTTTVIADNSLELGNFATNSQGILLSLIGATGRIATSANTATQVIHHICYNTNGGVGSISTTGSTTAFNTTSDANMKDLQGAYDPAQAIAIIRADPVMAFNWKTDGSGGVGWVAQHSYAVDPNLATPPPEPEEGQDRLAYGEDGYQPWGIDYGKRTPYLWAALTWALDKIDALEARIAALEAA